MDVFINLGQERLKHDIESRNYGKKKRRRMSRLDLIT